LNISFIDVKIKSFFNCFHWYSLEVKYFNTSSAAFFLFDDMFFIIPMLFPSIEEPEIPSFIPGKTEYLYFSKLKIGPPIN